MKLVIDVNVLLSALIKKGQSAELIFKEQLLLFAPAFFLEEWAKYRDYVLNKTSRDLDKFARIFSGLMKIITIVPKKEYNEYMDKATKICPDPNDVMYFALALKLNCPIWSNDKRLRKQNIVKVYSTKELLDMF